jgi:hypothetical protein
MNNFNNERVIKKAKKNKNRAKNYHRRRVNFAGREALVKNIKKIFSTASMAQFIFYH